jgi:single-strand DNA-binding protein
MINKAILIGNLGADPEMRATQNGTQVATFNIATTERWRGQDGQMQENTEWHRIVAWSKLADICGQYLQKGSRVYIEGRIQTRKWTDQNGVDRYTTEIIAREMKMLSSRGEGGMGGGSQGGYGGGGYQDNSFPESSSGFSGSGTGEDVPF